MDRLTALKIKYEDGLDIITGISWIDANNIPYSVSKIMFDIDHDLGSAIEELTIDFWQDTFGTSISSPQIHSLAIGWDDVGEPESFAFKATVVSKVFGELKPISVPSPEQIHVSDHSADIIELSRLAIAAFEFYRDSLPKQGELFALPDLEVKKVAA